MHTARDALTMLDQSADEFADLAVRLHDEPTVVETLELVVQSALKAIDCQYAGVMLIHGGNNVETAASTDPLVDELHQVQLECGEGPGLRAVANRLTIVVADTAVDRRWELWAGKVAALGVRSVLTARLATGDADVGTLNLFHTEPDAFDADDEAVASIFARHAAVALANARQAENLWAAIDARKLIGQAQGILMERFDLNADQAFAVLLRYSQQRNLKLRAVAELLVTRRRLPA
jgi:GAF domain-containing protein